MKKALTTIITKSIKSYLALCMVILIIFIISSMWLVGLSTKGVINLAKNYDESILLEKQEIPTVMATVTKTERYNDNEGPEKKKVYISYTYLGTEYNDVYYDFFENTFVEKYSEKPFEIQINPLHPEEVWEGFGGNEIASLIMTTLISILLTAFSASMACRITSNKPTHYWKKLYTSDITGIADVQKDVSYDFLRSLIIIAVFYAVHMGCIIHTAIKGYNQLNTFTTTYMLIFAVVLLTSLFILAIIKTKKANTVVKIVKDCRIREYKQYNSESADDPMWEFKKSKGWHVSMDEYVSRAPRNEIPRTVDYYIALNKKNKIKRVFNTEEFFFNQNEISEI